MASFELSAWLGRIENIILPVFSPCASFFLASKPVVLFHPAQISSGALFTLEVPFKKGPPLDCSLISTGV